LFNYDIIKLKPVNPWDMDTRINKNATKKHQLKNYLWSFFCDQVQRDYSGGN